MKAFVKVTNLSKIFALSEEGGRPVSLWRALRTGKREIVQREVKALDDVSFEIREGERVGIIGRNGAGKTTLLSIIAGISKATAGRLETGGDVHAILTIGAVLRDDATGRENIYLDAAVHGITRTQIEGKAEQIVQFAELGDFIDRPVRTYSSGMKARLAFSMAAFSEPDVLIIDETLAVGDRFFAEKAMRRMREITAKGRIVIVVTHALGSIVDICSRCLWLDQGRLIMDGDPATVTAAYEAAIEQSDEAELKRKFEAGEVLTPRPHAGTLQTINLVQSGAFITTSAHSFVPITIRIEGTLTQPESSADLELRILRVDGRQLWRERLSTSGGSLSSAGAFCVEARLDPFLLGANLYRIDAILLDGVGPIDAASRVVEVLDEKGQYGGTPLLFYPPRVTVSPIQEMLSP